MATTERSSSGSAAAARRGARRLHLGYSTNVHRGETLRQVYDFLRDYSIPVARRVFGDAPAGLELRFGIEAARELGDRDARERFRAFLEQSRLELFSVNAFPLQDFQARQVKERVYAPDWRSRDRVVWTRRIAAILADLMPPGVTGSVSTLGGTYRPWSHTSATLDRIADNYLRVLETLEEIEERTGRRVVLAAEPEPDTSFEVAADVIRFVEGHLLPRARERWRGRRPSVIEESVRTRFTVNLDTCHFSVLFHQPAAAIRELLAAGIAIGKIHVTSAPALRNPHRASRGYDVLRSMDEPRYLHQFCGVDGNGREIWRGRDLDELPPRLRRDAHPDLAELRTHFHVPLYLKRWRLLRTTQDETLDALRVALSRRACDHLVIETYTWPVLASEDRLVSGIAREYRWLLESLERLGAV